MASALFALNCFLHQELSENYDDLSKAQYPLTVLYLKNHKNEYLNIKYKTRIKKYKSYIMYV